MPALHNYVTVDTKAFASIPSFLLALFNMCIVILVGGDSGKDDEYHAVELPEVILLQCKVLVDQPFPLFTELVLSRLTYT